MALARGLTLRGHTATRLLPRTHAPISNAQQTWTQRAGVILRLDDELGAVGWGEASPLPGYSPDTIDDAHQVLTAFMLDPTGLDPAAPSLPDLGRFSEPLRAFPAARFAVETALLDLMAQRRREPLWQTLVSALHTWPEGSPPTVPLATLLTGRTVDTVLRQAEQAFARGSRVFKVKVGVPGAFAVELGIIDALRSHFGPALGLRLDANQAWSPQEAPRYLNELSRFGPEFIEEPVAGMDFLASEHGEPLAPEVLAALRHSPIPLALDESLQSPGAESVLPALFALIPLRALILKPTTLGGLARTAALALLARTHGGDAVLSHTFDGPLALTATSALALALPGRCAAGLDLHPALSNVEEAHLPALGSGALRVWSAMGRGFEFALPPGRAGGVTA